VTQASPLEWLALRTKRAWQRFKDYLDSRRKPDLDAQYARALERLISQEHLDAQALSSLTLVHFQRDQVEARKRAAAELRWKTTRRYLFVMAALSGMIGSLVLYLSRNGLALPTKNPVAVVTIAGAIGESRSGAADFIIPAMRRAFEEKRSPAVLLRINSPGGLPVDSERVVRELASLRAKHPDKRVYAVIETIGASAAFMIAVHADEVLAGSYSLVGSVGAIFQSWNLSEFSRKVGVSQDSYTSGELKELMSPFKPPTDAQRRKVMSLASGLGGDFAREVIAARKDRLKVDLRRISTGEVWTGTQALELGLIDRIGTIETLTTELNAEAKNFGPFASSDVGITERAARAFAEGLVETVAAVMRPGESLRAR
jgi:protease-4